MTQLSAILPLKTRGRHYADNIARCDILFSSLRHFTTPDVFAKFLIVVPHDEVEEAKRYAKAWSDFPVLVVDEAEYFPAFKDFNQPHQIRPWHRQQIIKLNAPAMIDTEYFLVFDPDCFATHPFTLETLLPGGRALTHLEKRNVDAKIWLPSAGLLNQDPELDKDGIWWTPTILSATICRHLHKRLEELFHTDWQRVLLANYTINWTEYTLYWLNADREGDLIERFHTRAAPGQRNLHAEESVWHAGEFKDWNAEKHFSPDSDGLFAVIQSNTYIPPEKVIEKLRPFFPITLQPYERHESLSLKMRELYSAVARRALGLVRRGP